MCLVRRFCPRFVDCLTFRFGQWFKNRFYREGWIAGWLNVFFCPLRRFFLFFFLLYIKINRRVAGTDEFIRVVGNCQATSMRRKSMYLRHRSTRDYVSQRSLARFRRHYVFEHHLTGVCILAKNRFLGDKFMFLPLPIPP